MRHASSRSPSPSSVTAASSSPAQPPRGPSSTTTSRLVFSTERSTVAASSGRSVRMSMTSQSMPSAASVSAADRHSCSRRMALTTVMSEPGRTTFASPSVATSPSTSPFIEYRRLCSKNNTGLSSRIAAFSSALASAGVDGATSLSPGMPWNQATGVCEWIAPKRPPPPTIERTVSGTLARSLEMYQYFAAWLTRLSIASGRKSPNMISTTGRRPATALPNAAPASASSEIGVSNTRSAPCFSISPGVTANTPPAAATSSPKKITESSRASSSSSACRIASRNSTSATLELRRLVRLGERRLDGGCRDLADLVVDLLLERVEPGLVDAVALDQPAAPDQQRIARAPLVELTGLAVAPRIAARVPDEAIRHRLDELRALAAPRPLDRLGRDLAHLPDVVAVDRDRRDPERRRAVGDLAGGDVLVGRELAVAVVLAHEHDGEAEDLGEVQALVEVALVDGAVAEERDRHRALAGALESERDAGGRRDAPTDDPEAADQAVLERDDVHRAGAAGVDPGRAAEQLVEQGLRRDPERERMAVAAVGARHAVGLREHGRDAGTAGLLAGAQVRGAVHEALEEQRLHLVLEAADQPHAAVELEVERLLALGRHPRREVLGHALSPPHDRVHVTRVDHVVHGPAVEVVLGHALLRVALHPVHGPVAAGHHVGLEPGELVRARVGPLVELVAAAELAADRVPQKLDHLDLALGVIAVGAPVELVEQRP